MNVAASKISSAPSSRRSYALTRIATVSDQLIVSVANFLLIIVIGRTFSVEELASYGIGLSVGLMVQALQRHAITIPLMLQPDSRVARRESAIATEQLGVLAIALPGVAIVLYAAQATGATRYMLLVLGSSAVCLLVYVQLEFARAFLTKLGRPALLIASAVYYAVAVLTLALAALSGRLDYVTLLVLLGAAMLLHAVAFLIVSG
jgi:hypothetical protein